MLGYRFVPSAIAREVIQESAIGTGRENRESGPQAGNDPSSRRYMTAPDE